MTALVTLIDGVTTDELAPYDVPSATAFQVQIPYSDMPSAGTMQVAILNGDGKQSAQLPFTVLAPGAPVLTTMNPTTGANSVAVDVSLSGSGFDSGAVVLVGSTAVTPETRQGNSGLSFLMTAALIPAAGSYNVAVKNASGLTSAALVFTAT